MLSGRLCAAFIAFMVVGGASAAPTTLQLFDPVPGSIGPNFQVCGLSKDGSTVVGYSGRSGAVWDRSGNGRFLTAPTGYSASQAFGVNADGSVVVGYGGTSASLLSGITWTNGVPALQSVIGPWFTQVWAVSDDGLVSAGQTANFAARWSALVGGGFAQSVAPAGASQSFARGINATGTVIVGAALVGTEQRAFKWTQAGGSRFLPAPGLSDYAIARCVSADGNIVFGAIDQRIARWVGDAAPQLIVNPWFQGGNGNACSSDGHLVVGTGHGPWVAEAVLWTERTGIISVRDLAMERGLDMERIELSSAWGVSGDGRTIVGLGGTNGQNIGFIFHIGDCPGDFDGDFRVDFFDYLDYVQAFAVGDAVADRDGDGTVDLFDYLDFVEAFGAGCE